MENQNKEIIVGTPGRKNICIFVSLFVLFLYLYTNFYSKDVFVANGGWRAARQFEQNDFSTGGNRHLLYYFHIYYFNKFLHSIGFNSPDVAAYTIHSSYLNALSGALGIAFFYLIILTATKNIYWSLWGAILLGFSSFYIRYSTTAAEPMPAFLFSLISVICSLWAIRRKSIVLSIVSGFFIGYAYATYQSFFSFFPALFAMFFLCEGKKGYRLAIPFAIAAISAILLIYISIYSHFTEIYGIRDFFLRFRNHEKDPPWLAKGFNFNNLLTLKEGLNRFFFKLPTSSFDEQILVGERVSVNYQIRTVLTASLWIFLSQIYCLAFGIRHLKRNLRPLAVNFIFLVLSILPAWYFRPTYAKLWLQPGASIISLCVIIITLYLPCASKRMRCFLSAMGLSFGALIIVWNSKQLLAANHQSSEINVLNISYEIDRLIEDKAMVFTDAPVLDRFMADCYPKQRTFSNLMFIPGWTNDKDLELRINEKRASARSAEEPFYLLVYETGNSDKTKTERKMEIIKSVVKRYEEMGKTVKQFPYKGGQYRLIRAG